MKNWEYKKLGDVCEIIGGTTPSTSVKEYWIGEEKWITPAEIKLENKYIYNSVKHISAKAVKDNSLRLLPSGTVIFTSRAPIGKVAISKTELYCNQGFKNFVCSEKIYNEYLYHFLSSKTDYLNSIGKGTTFKEISKAVISEVEIPLPSLEEQKRIVKILDEKFAQLETVKANAKANLQNAKDLFQSQLTKAFSNNDWEKITLQEICTLKSGNSSTNNSKPGDLPYVKVGDMTIPGNEISITTSSSFVDYEENKKQVFPIGSVIFPKRGGAILTNKKRITAVEICCDLNIMGVIPSDNILPEFLYYYFIGIDFAKLCNGAAIPQINNIDINPLEINLPPLTEQKRIVEQLDSLSQKVRSLEEIYTKQLANCDELKQAFLAKAFNGEL